MSSMFPMSPMLKSFRPFLAISLLGLAACAPRIEQPPVTSPVITTTAVTYADLPGWGWDNPSKALGALHKSCAKILARNGDKPLLKAALWAGRSQDWVKACDALPKRADAKIARTYFETHFRPLSVSGPSGADGLFTGYYEAELFGARKMGGAYRTPLYLPPADLIRQGKTWGKMVDGRLVPYDTREQIESGSLTGRAQVLAWLDDPAEAFFLHVQGSGRVRMEDGSVMRIGFAGRNGHPYKSIGRVLIDSGEVTREDMSLDAIRDWIAKNPSRTPALLAENPSYIFFHETAAQSGGPVGAQNVPLTPGRSLAIDKDLIPYGVPVWITTGHPQAPDQPFQRLMIAQDTGAAIKGAVRGDIFFGAGKVAETQAGHMKHPGRVWLLVPR